MMPDYKKYLKVIFWIIFIFFVGFLSLNLFGKIFIEEITQSLFINETDSGLPLVDSGNSAAYFELHNLKGKLVKLTDYKNTPLVIVFWSIWNDNAQSQIKIVDNLLKNNELFFKVLTVNSQEERKTVANFINRGLYLRPEVLLDTNGSVSDLYEARNLPVLYFINKEGIIKETFFGTMTEKDIVDKMSKYID